MGFNGEFLPVSRRDMDLRGWTELDFLYISGDAYVDHPSFGPAVICRCLESWGFKVGIVAQPDWRTRDDFTVMGRPRLGVLVSAGNMDSMLNKLTAARNKRRTDAYSPGGEVGHRPDRATIVYCNIARELWGDIPIVVGGIEASLRRMAHYDYWSDKVRRSMLMDSRADLLIYGMGERQIKEIAERLRDGEDVSNLSGIRGTCHRASDCPDGSVLVPSFDEVARDKRAFSRAFDLWDKEQDSIRGRTVCQPHGDKVMVQNPPALPLSTEEMDHVYDLPYTREPHPMYDNLGGVPAIEEVRFSIVSHRGCFGDCAFCAIVAHQGRIIQARSHRSILEEAKKLTEMRSFKGYIHDVGGPTANFRHPSCRKQLTQGTCRDRSCMTPEPCPGMDCDHSDYLELLRELKSLPNVKKVFIRSGVRYDYVLAGKNREFLEELCRDHVSGILKVAPEHCSPSVLSLMGKPRIEVFLKFKSLFDKINSSLNKKQYLIPYLISSHPGATLEDAISLAEFLRDLGHVPDHVQDFIPTPGSLSTCMYYTEMDPSTGRGLFVAKNGHEKALQRALLQYNRPENRDLVLEALKMCGREDLIGFGATCLVRPKKGSGSVRRDKVEKSVKSPSGRRGPSRRGRKP